MGMNKSKGWLYVLVCLMLCVCVPTFASADDTGSVTLQLFGAQAEVAYQLVLDETEYASGTASTGVVMRADDLQAGTYVLFISLPEDVKLTQINGVPFQLQGDLSFSVPVNTGAVQPIEMVLAAKGTISGQLPEAGNGASVMLCGEEAQVEAAVADGAFESEKLWYGRYEVSVLLPEGNYAGEGWTLEPAAGGVLARCICELNDEALLLPALEKAHVQRIEGVALDGSGKPEADVRISLADATGAEIMATVSGKDGAWALTGMDPGDYIVRAADRANVTVNVGEDETASVTLTSMKGTGSLEVTVFKDPNNNGECDKFEEMLEGVKVELLLAQGEAESLLAATDTDAKGKAEFSELADGEYRIRVTLPKDFGFSKKSEKSLRATSNIMTLDSNLTQTSADISVRGGAVQTAVGAMPMSAVSGQVWLDESADGMRDPGEPGQGGILIEARGVKNGLTYQTVSGEDGYYYLGQLRPGSYVVTYTLPEGLMFTRYSATGRNDRSIITDSNTLTGSKTFDLNKARNEEEQNVGVQREGTIQVTCFLDCNANGVYDEGDLPLPGAKCEVRKRSTDEVMGTAVSDEDGVAIFRTMRANTYKVRVILPDKALFTKVTEDGNAFSSKTNKNDAMLNDVVLEASGQIRLQAGAVILSSISGRVYVDNDFSGTCSAGEKGVSGMVVQLEDESGEVVAKTRTDNTGAYGFAKLTPGYYRLAIQAMDGYAFTRTGEGSVIINRGNGQGSTDVFFLPVKTDMANMDAGMIVPGSISGRVFVDGNDNGVRDAGENGLTSVIVSLLDESGSAVFTTSPAENGRFVFDAVMPGSYLISYQLPDRGVFADGMGLEDNTTSETIHMASGGSVEVKEVGVLVLPELSGVAFDDLNANGVMDEGEMPLAGVQLCLVPENAAHEQVFAMSGEDGAYRIAGIRPGTYTLRISFPAGYVMSRVGDELDIPVQPGAAVSETAFAVPSGAMWQDQVFGAVRPASLEGRVWMDANNNGMLDDGDYYAANERVIVCDMTSDSELTSLYTDENGRFATDGMIPGEYMLLYMPDGDTLLVGGTFSRNADGSFVMKQLMAEEGKTLSDISLGLMRYATLDGSVWVDMGGRIGALKDAVVKLTDAQGCEMATSTTDASGFYQFKKLMPGSYALKVELPEGYVVVEPDDSRIKEDGMICVMARCNRRTGESDVFNVSMGQHMDDLDIGAVLPGRLGDACWLDENGDGLYDVGIEQGIPNLTITLLKDGEVVTETVTDQYGFYCFTDLYPAMYTLRVTMPDSIKPTQMRDDYPGIVSVLQESGDSIPVEVLSQSGNYNADMGFVLTQKNVYPTGYGEGATQIWTTNK